MSFKSLRFVKHLWVRNPEIGLGGICFYRYSIFLEGLFQECRSYFQESNGPSPNKQTNGHWWGPHEGPACFMLSEETGSYNNLLFSFKLPPNGLKSCCFENRIPSSSVQSLLETIPLYLGSLSFYSNHVVLEGATMFLLDIPYLLIPVFVKSISQVIGSRVHKLSKVSKSE